MTTSAPESENPTQSQVLEVLGRLLYVCNSIELMIRWMNIHRGGFWTGKTQEKLLESVKKTVEKRQKEDKRMLGLVGPELIDAIYTPPCNKNIDAAEKESLFACQMDLKVKRKGRHRQALAKFQNFIDARNYLVHYFARDYSLETPESCQKAFSDLRKKGIIIQDAFNFFREDYTMIFQLWKDFKNSLPKLFEPGVTENPAARS